MSKRIFKIDDVARLAGVSTMTVSRVLSDKGKVAAKTRERVLQSARDLGYTANPLARGLRGGRSNIAGLVVQDLSNPYFNEIVLGVSEAISGGGTDLLLYTSSNDPKREKQRVQSLSSGLADGMIIISPYGSRPTLELAERSRVPVVFVNYWGDTPDLPRVNAENYHGARAATEHLLALGHRRVALITGRPDIPTAPERPDGLERHRGYRDALMDAGVALDRRLVVPGGLHQPQGRDAGRELLNLAEPPTAIFAANDFCAFGVMEAVQEKGLRVPEDISVVGFDDIRQAAQVSPALTTVHHPLELMGKTAAKLLLELVAGVEPSERRVELPSELTYRSTTAPPRERDSG